MIQNKVMKNILSLTLFLLIASSSTSQENSPFAEQWEVYGMEVILIEKLLSDNLKCGKGWLEEDELTLYKIAIRNILFQRDSTVFSISELQKVNYIVLPSRIKVELNKKYFITAGNSSVKNYLTGFRLLESDMITEMDNYNAHSYLQGLEQCYKLSFWDRVRLFLGADESKIYKELRNEEKVNPFYRYILQSSKI